MEGITYQQIEAANKTIKTTDIKGKEYADVAQRVRAFRMVYPTGQIFPRLISDENGVCKFSADVGYYDETGAFRLLAVGHAFERENGSYINKTSYIENCETSAVGRALGMAGFGIDASICSADELNNALAAQEAAKQQPKQAAKKPAPAAKEAPAPAVDPRQQDAADEQAAIDAAKVILETVTDAATATAAIKPIFAIKHAGNSRRTVGKIVNEHMEALGLVYNADAKAYVAKEASAK